MDTRNNRGRIFLVATLVVLLAIAIFIYAERGKVYAEMNNLKLVPQNEAFTELYFNDYAALPKNTVAGQPVAFSFTIHNVEGVTTTYPYNVYFAYPNGAKDVFASTSITLASDASSSITIYHTFATSNLEGQVVVDLSNLNQTIDFILPDTNP